MVNLPLVLILLCSSLAFSRPYQSIRSDGGSDSCDTPLAANDDCPTTLPNEPDSNAQFGIERFRARGDSVDWGLALSGGGMRSGGFDIGVMKVLYDEKYLEKIDVISGVSGGGYAIYWLYTKHNPSDTLFGESAFKDDKFVQNTCRLQNKDKSDFFTNTLAIKTLPFLFSEGKVFNRYEDRINTSFGNEKPRSTKLCFLNSFIEKGKVPYFILNTTLKLPENKKRRNEKLRKLSSEVFEITPEFRGNPDLGFREWAQHTDAPLTFSESVAASAIPSLFTYHKIDNYNQQTVPDQKLQLYDGGESENLAALALIRRGIENIIIIDSYHDPHYEFKAYSDLKKMLLEIGVTLHIKDIEEYKKKRYPTCLSARSGKYERRKVFSCNAVALGTASSNGTIPHGGTRPVKSKIYYLKMTNP
ncbi:MAG TPA: patatin-like phospholipase family protein, partial [Pyrinomonadaceae bacterium]